MPRRRMIDPDFWNDSRVKRLSPTERLLFIGMISHADDDGRLLADPAFLRSKIFPYDDFSLEDITSMLARILEVNPNVQLYQNAGEDYLYFRKWTRYQKPSHPQPSKLPQPPEIQESVQEQIQEIIPEQDQPQTRTIPSQVRLGQVRSGQVSLDQVREVQEDFTEFLDKETDLTDLLTTTLKKHMSAGRERASPGQEEAIAAQWGMPVLAKFWKQATGTDLSGIIWHSAYAALQKYPADVMAIVFVRASPYEGGKHKSWKYFQAIIDEEVEKHGRSPPH